MNFGSFLLAIAACLTVVAISPSSAIAQTGIETPGDTAFSGRAFFNLTDMDSRRNGARLPGSGARLDLKRLYLIVDHRLTDIITANLTTDFQYDSADGSTELMAKKAYLQAKASDALMVRLGAADTPWISFADTLHGYRFIEQSLVDRLPFGSSADWGVHASGDLPGDVFSYAVSVIGGGGHEDPAWTETLDFEGRLSAEIHDVTLAIGGYSGQLGENTAGGPPDYHRARRFNAMAAYVGESGRLGLEYFAAANWDAVLSIAEDRAVGFAAFASYRLKDRFSAVVRYDQARPNKRTAPELEERYFHFGLTFSPIRNLDVALLYKRSEAEDSRMHKEGSDEIGLWSQMRF